VRRLAVIAWVPVVVGAAMATYGNTVWSDVGLATWTVGLAIQLGAFLLWFRASDEEVPEGPVPDLPDLSDR
jgi:hypothetical protein